MQLPQVDVVGAQAAQGGVEGGEQGGSGGAAADGAGGAAGGGFGGDDEFVAGDVAGQQVAEDFFGGAVDVGGVDEGAACVVEGGELVGGGVGVDVESPGHGAQGEAGDAEAAAAELSVFHGG